MQEFQVGRVEERSPAIEVRNPLTAGFRKLNPAYQVSKFENDDEYLHSLSAVRRGGALSDFLFPRYQAPARQRQSGKLRLAHRAYRSIKAKRGLRIFTDPLH